MISREKGIELLKIARKAIENYLKEEREIKVKNTEFCFGCFVTLKKHNGELRGCIGFINGNYGLEEIVVKAAISSALYDYRFKPLTKTELKEIGIEVSVLSKTKEIKGNKEKLLKEIMIGKHGLIIECKEKKGLLLPQVATEHKMNVKEFLEACCKKAGLERNCWNKKECKIFTFEAKIFKENN